MTCTLPISRLYHCNVLLPLKTQKWLPLKTVQNLKIAPAKQCVYHCDYSDFLKNRLQLQEAAVKGGEWNGRRELTLSHLGVSYFQTAFNTHAHCLGCVFFIVLPAFYFKRNLTLYILECFSPRFLIVALIFSCDVFPLVF